MCRLMTLIGLSTILPLASGVQPPTTTASPTPATPPTVPAPAVKSPKVAKRDAHVIHITGGLDCRLVATRIIEAADAADREHAPVLLLELENVHSYRDDIVRDVVVRLKSLPVPMVVWDASPQGQNPGVGTCRGVAMLMIAASASGSREPSIILPLDSDTRTCPAKSNGALIRADLREVLGPMAAKRGLPSEAVDLVVGSSKRLWWVSEAPAAGTRSRVWRVVASNEKPKVDAGTDVLELTTGMPTPESEVRAGRLSPNQVESFFGSSTRNDVDSLLVGYSAKMPSKRADSVVGGVEWLWIETRDEFNKMDELLLTSSREGRTVADRIKGAERVVAGIDAIDERLVQYPEIAMLTPPDGIETGSKPATNTTAWRSKLKALKDRANKAIEKAKAK